MAIGFPGSPFNKKQFSVDSKLYEYNSTLGAWSKGVRAPVSPGTASITDISNLVDGSSLLNTVGSTIPSYATEVEILSLSVGVQDGQMAYAEDTDKLYVFSGYSWYKTSTAIEYVPPAPFNWGGDRAVIAGGWIGGSNTSNIEYFSISSFTASASFGTLGTSRHFLRGGGSNGTTGIFPGGYLSSSGPRTDEIKYVTTATTANASLFGALTSAGDEVATASNGVYGIMAGGGTRPSVIDYITIATTSDATSFGLLTIEPREGITATSDANYILLSGGSNLSGGSSETLVEYVVADTPGNAVNFGTLTTATDKATGFSDQTRSVIAGGEIANTDYLDTIEYITTAVGGTSTSFGNLTIKRGDPAGAGDGTYGVVVAGKPQNSNGSSVVATMDYLTIQTNSNAQSFGNLTNSRTGAGGLSGSPS